MAAVKPDAVARAVRSPGKATSGYLLFGSDDAQIADHAGTLAAALAAKSSPPGEIHKFTDADMAEDPSRAAIALQTVPMFGGPPIVWAKSAQRLALDDMLPALAATPIHAYLIVEAGNLPKTSKLRQAFEAELMLAALPCYGNDAGGVSALIDRELAAAKLAIDADAKQALLALLGANIALARTEIEKLTIYAAKDGRITTKTVASAVGDVAVSAVDDVINAALTGDARTALVEWDPLSVAGFAAQTLLALLNSHLLRLLKVRGFIDEGESFAVAARRLRPPLFFKAEKQFSDQIRIWPTAALAQALSTTLQAVQSCRLNPALEHAYVEAALLKIALAAKRG
jgi:DNA polymerase-3 subunit delta